MRQLKYLITGILSVFSFLLATAPAHAGVCGVNSIDDPYLKIYCRMNLNENEENDKKLIKTVAAQFEIKEDIAEDIINDTICDKARNMTIDEQNELPDQVLLACFGKKASTEEVLGGLNFFREVKETYEKEKSMQLNAASLEFKFKASERFWDGKLVNAPFDLVLDLNLIEIVLFGSQAQWLNDVYIFPTDDDEDDEDGEAPIEDLPSDESDEEDDDEPTDLEDPGLIVEVEEEDGTDPDCVPPDHPEADPGDGPGSEHVNEECGNGVLDILLGEQCDDGNLVSGDGCSQYCQEELNGSSNICQDPDAVTFDEPGDDSSGGGDDGGDGSEEEDDENECPEGTVPKKKTKVSGQDPGEIDEVPQAFEYPGPFVGGTMKQFPASQRPNCPQGYSEASASAGELDVTASGDETLGLNVLGKQYDIPKCLPTEFCADFDQARDFLFGPGWVDDEALANVAESIEALFCVNVKKNNRPLSPYKTQGGIQGCIDCYIAEMVDAVEEALQTNVTPLENTTSGFGISSKFGPNFSFNLLTSTKRKLKYVPSNIAVVAIDEHNQTAEENIDNSLPKPTGVPRTDAPLAQIEKSENLADLATEEFLENTKMIGLSNDVISDQQVHSRVLPLLIQMKESFERIQSKWFAIVQSTEFDKKLQCKP